MTLSGDKVLQGKVRLVAPTAGSLTHMGNLRISMTDPDHRVRAGMFASARVLVTARQGLAVSSGEVITNGDRPEILVFGAEGVLEERPVTPGLYTAGTTEILSGLSEGDRVLARASASRAELPHNMPCRR